MKKTLLCSLLLIGVAQADEVEKTSAAEAVAEENASADKAIVTENTPAADTDTADNAPSMDGFYAGLRVQYFHTSSKVRAADGVDANGLAIQVNTELSHQQIDKFGGTLVAGYGKSVGKIYIGGEALLDVNADDKTNSNYVDNGDVHPYYLKVNGIVPSVAVRIGCWCPKVNSSVYAKVGAAMVMLRAEVQEKSNLAQNNVRKMNKITPIIGFGFGKKIHDRLNLRGEFEYRVQAKRTTQTYSRDTGFQYNVENRLKGLGLRVMLVYRF